MEENEKYLDEVRGGKDLLVGTLEIRGLFEL